MNEGWIVKNMRTGSIVSGVSDSHSEAWAEAKRKNREYQTNEFWVVGYREEATK